MRLKIFTLFVLLSFIPVSHAYAMRVESIAAVVNEEVVTASDVEDRMALIIASSGLQNRKDIKERIRPKILEDLIAEQLKLQEAERHEVEVSDEEIQQGFASIARQNNVEPDIFKKQIEKSGINIETMFRQIRSQLAWNKVVQKVLRSRVNVTDNDVEAFMAQIKSSMGKKEYLVAEIFLPVDDPKQDSNARQLANRLIGEIKTGKAPFSSVAQQFSEAAGASRGGDLGWIQEGQLDEEIDEALSKMQEGSLSDAVRSASGYHILLVRGTREITEENVPELQDIRNRIGLERLEKLQQRYLFDIRADAFIEYRAGS